VAREVKTGEQQISPRSSQTRKGDFGGRKVPANDGRCPRMGNRKGISRRGTEARRAGLKECGRPAHREGALWEGVVRWQAGRLHSLNFSASQRLGGRTPKFLLHFYSPVSPHGSNRRGGSGGSQSAVATTCSSSVFSESSVRDIFMRCLARSRSSRPSGCLRQAARPAPAGTCSGFF
jgi:hypothetical protein